MTKRVMIKVWAVPVKDTGQRMIECNLCGPIGTADELVSDMVCVAHLNAHEVDTTKYRKIVRSVPIEGDPDPDSVD
jgi:hypothetical protein